jgi:hypothetical protein
MSTNTPQISTTVQPKQKDTPSSSIMRHELYDSWFVASYKSYQEFSDTFDECTRDYGLTVLDNVSTSPKTVDKAVVFTKAKTSST